MSRTPLRAWIAVSLVAAALTALVACFTWEYRYNVLYTAHHGWVTQKSRQGRYTMGGVSYMLTRPALCRDTLDLAAWHGYQEVLWRQPFPLLQAHFDALIGEGSWVALVFGRNDQGCWGVRISRRSDFPCMGFQADGDGMFVQRFPLQATPGGHSVVDVKLHDGQADVAVDGVAAGSFACSATAGLAGFQGSLLHNAVYNVTFDGPQGLVVHDSFSNWPAVWPLLPGALLWMLLLNGALWLWWRRDSAVGPRLLTVNVWFLGAALLTLGVEWFVFAPRYPNVIHFAQYPEFANFWEIAPLRPQITEELQKRYEQPPPGRQILFIGSSQTWGSGANTEADTWVRRLETRLNAEHASQGPFVCVNGGICGARSQDLLEAWTHDWTFLHPTAVVIDLGFNDPDAKVLISNMQAMLVHGKEEGARGLVIVEAASAEYRDGPLYARQEALRHTAWGVPVIDMPSFLDAHQDAGFLWWDPVHLSSCGQKIFAGRVYPELEKLLNL
ncbi:MAG: SGNH/GDSL hydrolase family protein [Candidatus Xenobia bacterium]